MTQTPGPPQPAGSYYPPPPPPGRPTNTMAIVSLVCAFVFAPAGLVCGFIARKQIKLSGEDGDGLALAGIIISAIQIVIGILAIIFVVLAFAGLIAAGNDIVDNLPSPSPLPTS